MNAYEFIAIYRPCKDDSKDSKALIIVEPKIMLAKDEKHAAMQAARVIPEEYADKLDEVEIRVRPF